MYGFCEWTGGAQKRLRITYEQTHMSQRRPLLATPSPMARFLPRRAAGTAVSAILVQPDGRILVAGTFTNVGPAARAYVARLNPNGSLDTSFDPGAGPDGPVNAVALDANGRVLIGGAFKSIGNVPRNGLARMNSAGALDSTFQPAAAFEVPEDTVTTLLVQSDGRVVVGGHFQKFAGSESPGVARLEPNGALDPSFRSGLEIGDRVHAAALAPDGKFLVVGVASISDFLAARLNPDGSKDDSFAAAINGIGECFAVAALPNGDVLAGGSFGNPMFGPTGYLERMNPDGTLDSGFRSLTGPNYWVSALATQADGKLLIGGFFKTFGSIRRESVARLNLDGTLDPSFDAGAMSGIVTKFVVEPSGSVLIAGDFREVGGVSRNRVARLTSEGRVDSSFDPGEAANDYADALALQSDGKIA